MTRRKTARSNRAGLILVALVLLAGGGYALLRGAGQLAGQPSNDRVVPGWLREFSAQAWFGPAMAVLAGIVALLALGWLLAQTKPRRLRELVLAEDERGSATIAAAAFAAAVAAEAGALPGVRRARAAIIEGLDRPLLRITIIADDHANLGQLLNRITSEVAAEARDTIQPDTLPTLIRLRLPGRHQPPRVI